MRQLVLLLLSLGVAHASVSVTRTSDKALHPSEMEIEVQLPSSKKVRIPLNKIDAFENVPMTVLSDGAQRTFSARQAHNPSHSHYRNIESRSVISVRHVKGQRRMSGHVTHEGTAYRVEPFGESEHRVTKSAALPDIIDRQVDRKKNLFKALSRKKRQSPSLASTPNVVEINLLLDHTVWNTMKTICGDDDNTTTELHYYYTHILNGIDTAFRNINDPPISVKCISLTVSTSPATSTWMPAAGASDADQAGVILSSMNSYSVGKPGDHIMAFTRTDIKSGTNTAVCGMAYVSGTCNANRQSINEDQGLHSWGTAAHELGHNLASDHDGTNSTMCAGSTNIMAPGAGIYTLGNVVTSYAFSSCSILYMGPYITGTSGSCLRSTDGSQVAVLSSTVREGARMSLDQVCKLAFPNSPGKHFLTDEASANPATICAKIYCQKTATANSGVTSGGLRAPLGSPCGYMKSCNREGQCTSDSSALPISDSCFWGDSWDAATCSGWGDYIKYLKGVPDIPNAKVYCGQAMGGCCSSLGATCTF